MQYAEHLSELHLSGKSHQVNPPMFLPCDKLVKLQRLCLRDIQQLHLVQPQLVSDHPAGSNAGHMVLQLHMCTAPVAGLAQLTLLQELELNECRMLPFEAVTHPGSDAVLNSAGTAALLAALCKLTRLQQLFLAEIELDTVTQPAHSFAALTASSKLQQLRIFSKNAPPVALGAVQNVFPPGRRMGDLKTLTLRVMVWDDYMHTSELLPLCFGCMGAQDLGTVLSTCPALESLDVGGALTSPTAVAPLLQLPTSCASLTVGGQAFDDTAAAVVAQLTQLTSLAWAYADLTDAGLEQLTSLTRLSSLLVDCCDLSRQLEESQTFILEAKPGEVRCPTAN